MRWGHAEKTKGKQQTDLALADLNNTCKDTMVVVTRAQRGNGHCLSPKRNGQRDTFLWSKSKRKTNLRNGTKVEDRLIAQAGHERKNIGDVLQCVGHKMVQARYGLLCVFSKL